MIVCDPPAVGVYVTVQVPPASVQVAALKVPLPLVLQVMLPVGVPVGPVLVSVTVAVQVVVVPAVRLVGVQLALVLVARLTTSPVAPVLPACAESPAYEAVSVCDPVALGV